MGGKKNVSLMDIQTILSFSKGFIIKDVWNKNSLSSSKATKSVCFYYSVNHVLL